MGDTVNIQGAEADMNAVLGIESVAYTTSSTEILSAAIQFLTYPRKRMFVVFNHKADATSTGVTVTVKESATSGGSYATATFTGSGAASTSARTGVLEVKRNPAKLFVKISMTPAGGSGVVSASALFID